MTTHMSKGLLIALCIYLFSSGSLAKTTVLYQQNSQAERVSGSIEKLKQAIRAGKPIRIYMNLGFVEHAMDAGFLSIIGDNVYAQINGIEAQIPNRTEGTITLRPYARHVGLYSTQSRYEMTWFIAD